MKAFDVFICYKKSSGQDFASHLNAGLDELGYRTFLDSQDIPKMTDGICEWIEIRDQALKESKNFILIITPGFDLSEEVKKELEMAREEKNKKFLYFRHRDLGRKIVVNLATEKLDLGRQEQVSFESKEELLRLAHGILVRESSSQSPGIVIKTENQKEIISVSVETKSNPTNTTVASNDHNCEMCLKPIEGQPYPESIDGTTHYFHGEECAKTYKRLKSLMGDSFK